MTGQDRRIEFCRVLERELGRLPSFRSDIDDGSHEFFAALETSHVPSDLRQRLDGKMARGGWEAWATMVADRSLLERRVQTVVASMRDRIETEEIQLAKRKLDALGEFAGGAGHELNNPLAVIVGRAQLLLARTEDPEMMRSLGIILNQAGRAHRILRDLMFVARPPAPRPRPCRPAELLRACLRDLEEECAARGIRLAIAELHNRPRQMLERLGLAARLGPGMIFHSAEDAADRFEARQAEKKEETATPP